MRRAAPGHGGAGGRAVTRRAAFGLGMACAWGAHADPVLSPLSALRPVVPPTPVPAEVAWRVVGADGTATLRTVAQAQGRAVLLNVWATWCGPCVLEMPALDLLAQRVAGAGIDVVPVSIDHGGAAAVRPFYARAAIRHLPLALDADARTRSALAVGAVPVSVLIGPDGMLRARIDGATDWSAPDVIPRLHALLG